MKNFKFIANEIIRAAESKKKGIIVDIEKDTTDNDNFRKVIYTGKNLQLVLMSLKADEDIGEEAHTTIDQFFRVDAGSGKVIINGNESTIKNGSAFIVPTGAKHNIIAGKDGLKVYTLYGPPNHKDKTVHKTKKIAEEKEEEFDGKTTE